jgi:hypothetical protein
VTPADLEEFRDAPVTIIATAQREGRDVYVA